MRTTGVLCGLAAGVALGGVAALFYLGQPKSVGAASSDRHDDYVMATGAVTVNPKVQTDGVWLLDYKSGKLLGTVIDRAQGKILGWAEVDLVTEFEVAPKQDVHFMMVTGYIAQGQSALYVAETTTGKFGVYTMGAATTGAGSGIVIRRHDMASFRKEAPPALPFPAPAGAAPAGGVPPPGAVVPTGGQLPLPGTTGLPAVAGGAGLPGIPPVLPTTK